MVVRVLRNFGVRLRARWNAGAPGASRSEGLASPMGLRADARCTFGGWALWCSSENQSFEGVGFGSAAVPVPELLCSEHG